MLVSLVDHGISPSQAVTRWVAASGSPVQASTAAGVLTFGDYHGGAGKQCGEMYIEYLERTDGDVEEAARSLVSDKLESGERIPGYGHPEHPEGDPRCPPLFEIAREEGVAGKYVAMAESVEESLAEALGGEIPVNMDGAIPALLLDLGFDPSLARPFITIARLPGLVAHHNEELEREEPWREVPGGVEYDGPSDRSIGDE
jgi:citrate synthase/citryl-CoA lyase